MLYQRPWDGCDINGRIVGQSAKRGPTDRYSLFPPVDRYFMGVARPSAFATGPRVATLKNELLITFPIQLLPLHTKNLYGFKPLRFKASIASW